MNRKPSESHISSHYIYEIYSIADKFAGMPTLAGTFTLAGFAFFSILMISAFAINTSQNCVLANFDRTLFWFFGFLMFVFLMLRPFGLARDDLAYAEMIQGIRLPDGGCIYGDSMTRDYSWCGIVRLGLAYWPNNIRLIFALSGFGFLIKLFVIDRLCKERLLALLLLIPLSYVQYDLTQFRAGFAISWMLLGIWCLIKSRTFLAGIILFSNFTAHSQAIFSPGFLGYRLVDQRRWILPVGVMVALFLIHFGLYPTAEILSGLGFVKGLRTYLIALESGAYLGVKIFPLGYFLMLGYGVWLCDGMRNSHHKISQIVSMGILLAAWVSWFFTINPAIQTRMFEFYITPLVLLAGNIGHARIKVALTCLLALVLYLRLELFNDWILG